MDLHSDVLEMANKNGAWPFREARKIIDRYKNKNFPETIVFETGYSPSGLPHIGTFGEVVRTSMVRHAFHVLTKNQIKTRLLCFSDDMDGLRKVPENIPSGERLLPYLQKPLILVPDPFEEYESFGHHNNAMLCRFLDSFGFDYEFASAHDYYSTGCFDDTLICMLENYEKIMQVMLPTLREERRKTYSPILPIHPLTGIVMQVPMQEVNAALGVVVWTDPETGKSWETSVKGGKCKAQWKPDWALRWAALKVDYEMSGKDHIDNVKTSAKICRILGGVPPEGFNYELFLDEKGEKISKSKGNGVSIEEWLTYAPAESLGLYMFQKPGTAKRLYFDVIPKAVDQYYSYISSYSTEDWKDRLSNPVWHLHYGNPPEVKVPISFSLLLNLVSASNASEKSMLWGFISRHAPDVNAQAYPELDRLADYALQYFADIVRPGKVYHKPDDVERETLRQLKELLEKMDFVLDSNTIQSALLDLGRNITRYQDFSKISPHGTPGVSLEFFKMIYKTLFGQDHGPRFGSFVALYGINETCSLIDKALEGILVANNPHQAQSVQD